MCERFVGVRLLGFRLPIGASLHGVIRLALRAAFLREQGRTGFPDLYWGYVPEGQSSPVPYPPWYGLLGSAMYLFSAARRPVESERTTNPKGSDEMDPWPPRVSVSNSADGASAQVRLLISVV